MNLLYLIVDIDNTNNIFFLNNYNNLDIKNHDDNDNINYSKLIFDTLISCIEVISTFIIG